MTVEIISWSISTKVWDQTGIKLATPGSAVRHASVAGHVTDCATRPRTQVWNIIEIDLGDFKILEKLKRCGGTHRLMYRHRKHTPHHKECRGNIRIHHKCEGGIEKSVLRITDWHHEACRVMTIGDNEWWIFLSHAHTNNGFFFLLILENLKTTPENPEHAKMQHTRVLHQVECLGVPGTQLWLWWGSHHWKWGSHLFI